MEKDPLPKEIHEFFDRTAGRSLIVKGQAGTGKTILSLTMLEEMGIIDNSYYFSTRVSNRSLYSQFPWLKDRDMLKNLIDASTDFLKALYPQSEEYTFFREKRTYEMEKVEKAREVLQKLPGADEEFKRPETVATDNLLSLVKDGEIKELLQMYQKVDSCLPDPSLIIIDSLESLIERYRINPTELIKALQKDLVEMSGVRLVIILETAENTQWDYLVDGVITLSKTEEDGRRYRKLSLDKMRGIRIEQPLYLYTLDNGRFDHCKSFSHEIPHFKKAHAHIKDGEGSEYHEKGLFSTGTIDLDSILGGGYPRNGLVVLDVTQRVPVSGQMHLYGPVLENFLAQERGVLIMLSRGRCKDMIIGWINEVFGDISKCNVKVLEMDKEITDMLGQTISNRYEHIIKEAYRELKFRSKGPILTISDWIGVENTIIGEELTHGEVTRITRKLMNIMKDNSDLMISLMGPGFSLSEKEKYLSDVHLKLFTKYNSLMMYGEKPNTGVYNIYLTGEKHPKANFVPLV